MSVHTVRLQENEFRLFQSIQQIEIDLPSKEHLIEDLIQQIEQWMQTRSLSARTILNLPPQERQRILTDQFQAAAALYHEHPELIVPDGDEPLTY